METTKQYQGNYIGKLQQQSHGISLLRGIYITHINFGGELYLGNIFYSLCLPNHRFWSCFRQKGLSKSLSLHIYT